MIKTTLSVFLVIALSATTMFAQDKTFGLKFGYAITNAYAPNGTLILYTDGSAGQDVSSFEYKPGFQIGVSKKIDLNQPEGYLYISGSYATYGFKDEGENIDLNYIDLEANVHQDFGRNKNLFASLGFGPSILVSDNNKIEVQNKFDLRMNLILGIKVIENINFFFQGKGGWIGLSKESKIKSYLLSFNTEILLF